MIRVDDCSIIFQAAFMLTVFKNHKLLLIFVVKKMLYAKITGPFNATLHTKYKIRLDNPNAAAQVAVLSL